MNHDHFFPFERNRYFYGKLLTVRDFEVEQKYNRSKRELLNRVIFGAGVVCGFGVSASDDTTLMIESGLALDYQGREALKAYAKSSVDRFALYQAQIARNEAAIALYEALAEFAGQVNALNALSGGWLSKEAAWLDDVLPAIYQNEVGKGRAQAEAKEQEQIQKEQEAKEQLEEGKP